MPRRFSTAGPRVSAAYRAWRGGLPPIAERTTATVAASPAGRAVVVIRG